MGHCQPNLIHVLWTILVVLEYPLLHTKFQDHRSTGSGEEDFLRFLPSGGCIRNSVPNGPMVSEEKLFIIMDGQTMEDG